jgi:Na+(H+)/acetate symporter ActP
VFLFYTFQQGPLLFNPAHEQQVRAVAPMEYEALEQRYTAAGVERAQAARNASAARQANDPAGEARAIDAFRAADAAVNATRTEALDKAATVTGQSSRDVNYIIPRFVLDQLPIGLAGVFLAAVLAAAMSSIAAELNSLSTATVVDFYQRWFKPSGSDAHYLTVSKIATAIWGLFACIVATYAATLGSLIEVVNRFGSFFYGSILGVFLLAMMPRARALGAFIGLIAGMGTVAAVSFGAPSVSFLWHNVIGAVTVVVVGVALSTRRSSNTA